MGKLKNRIKPRDITINIGKDAPIPECSIPGERWKEVKHDNNVTWLAFWNDPINPKEFKYVFLAASSSLKGQSDKEKYEKARLLKLNSSKSKHLWFSDSPHSLVICEGRFSTNWLQHSLYAFACD
ncbi:hypothetical protein ZIOFF_002216 [Zingiber officinale]|uniref:DNA topoisomerase I eukaryotic-type domain-containing protein n=1 Tax=Zingiber officinale TaxID=94328 RepID=A0A8J5LSR2_ZINOF|nr:hypothetical protein ZIOFF_002216 [Zingiber officinale]